MPSREVPSESSVRIFQEKLKTSPAPSQRVARQVESIVITKGWVGFDEENVVVLQERKEGQQTLTIFDFS